MRWLVITGLIIMAFLISSCGPAEVECKKPFIKTDGECCLDLDDDSVCDEEQEEKEAEPEVTVEVEETTPIEVEKKEVVEEEPEEEPEEEIEEEVVEEEPEEEPEAEEPKTKIEQLLEIFAQKVDGYKYAYKSNWFYVRGDKIKVRLYTAMSVSHVTIDGNYYSLFHYDNVYLDKKEKTAVAYCEGTDPRIGKRQCANLEIEDKPYQVSYDTYYEKLPEEWLFEFLDKEPTDVGENKYYIRGRRTTKVTFEEGDKITRMYFDETTGLPIKVEVAIGDVLEIYDYNELTAGTVRAEDVIHRSASDIPSSEAFYSTYD